MGFLDTIRDEARTRLNAKNDRFVAMITALPDDTIWAASADVEVGHRNDVRGVLFHNGRTVRFQAFHKDLRFEVDASMIEHRRGEAITEVDGKRCEIDSVRPLGLGKRVELPAFADVSVSDGPMYGFFATLGIPV